jgi:hypothetical protein
MTQSAQNQKFLMDIIAELSRSRRDKPGASGNFGALNDAMVSLARALLNESSECVREAAIDVAVGAIRVACDGCHGAEKRRAEKGLDAVTAHLIAHSDDAAAAH